MPDYCINPVLLTDSSANNGGIELASIPTPVDGEGR